MDLLLVETEIKEASDTLDKEHKDENLQNDAFKKEIEVKERDMTNYSDWY